MGTKLANKFAFKNMKANKIFVIPFILSSSIMIALFNIMICISQNEYVRTRHVSLPILINFGVVIIGIFSFIFIIYANRFLVKRRNKEFALYAILGLEKKHIRKIIFIEQTIIFAITTLISIVGGFILGKLMFLMVNKLIESGTPKLSNYPFSTYGAVITLAYILVIFIVIYLLNIKDISKSSPMELLSKQYQGESEPKSKLLLTIIGLALLAGGYFLALHTEGTLKSLGIFFLASLLVIFATYFLFISFSIVVLKLMKKDKKKYYKDKNFISISGMMYRMKGNALGLASIAVLCTGVIITLSATLTIYKNMDNIINTTMSRDYTMEPYKSATVYDSQEDIEARQAKAESIVRKNVGKNEKISKIYSKEEMMTFVYKDGDSILSTDSTSSQGKLPCYIIVSTIDSYNQETGQNIKLRDDQVLISANNKNLIKGMARINLMNKAYDMEVQNIDIPGNIAVESYRIIVPSYKQLLEAANFYKVKNIDTGKWNPSQINLYTAWNVENSSKDYFKNLEESIGKKEYFVKAKSDLAEFIYQLNGGFLFLGIMIGLIFLIGTILITYYKQVSEGYEDRKQYQIMKKVGLPDELIKKTAETQIVWMFFIPLIVALIHSLVASKIVYQLLGLFGVYGYYKYGINIAMVIGLFAVVYLVIFKVTSNIYYKIVK